MLAPQSSTVATVMLLGTMLCWGSWSSIRMQCRAEGPVFVVLYIFGQFFTGMLLGATLGMTTDVDGYFDSKQFFLELGNPGVWYRVIAIMVGGAACANSDFLASCAMSRLPFAVVVPVFMGWALVQATILNYLIEGSDTNPFLLFSGIFMALCAIGSMALSDVYSVKEAPPDFYRRISRGDSFVDVTLIHQSGLSQALASGAADSSSRSTSKLVLEEGIEVLGEARDTNKQPVLNRWMYITIVSGMLAGVWSPLQVFGRHGKGAVDSPSVILFFFQLGEVISLPFMLYYHGHVIVPMESKYETVSSISYWVSATELSRSDKLYGLLAGSCVACGSYIFFTASEVIPSTIAFAISSCAPLVTIALGIFVFKQLSKASFYQRFYILLSTFFFVVAISLMVLADMFPI